MRRLTLIVGLLLLSLSARTQSNETGIDYEGQPVGAVDLVTDPSIDVQNLRHLVTQKAGQPYSKQKVQSSIAALKDTGIFQKVDVEVKPESNGLHVMFVMEPTYYYGITQFPGATKVFNYTRLLQVVDLPDQDPYVPQQVEQGQAALLRFLQHNGFFQAQVQPSTVLDKAHGLANVIYQVKLGKRARIGELKVQGPPTEESNRLLSEMRPLRAKATGSALKPGKPYSPERIKAGTALLRKYLIKHDHLASRIHVGEPQYHPETNRADVTINVDEGPTVAVRVTGARLSLVPFLSGRQQKKMIPIYQEGSVDSDLIDEGKRNLIDYFQSKGYFDVHVNTAVQQQPNKISLVYSVEKGKKHKVESIAFRGNHHIDEDELRKHIIIQKHHLLAHGKFSNKLLSKSVSALKAVYQDQGFEEVSVTPEVVDKEPNIEVTFQIAEGPQTQVESVNFEGNQNFTANALSPPSGFLLRAGSPYSPGRMSKDRGKILAAYLDHGYLRADVKTKVERRRDDPHQVSVTYEINEGQLVRISQVVMEGQQRTRPRLIAKTADLRPEAPLSQGKLLASESELYNLGIFDWASIGPRRPITDENEEEAVIKVHESKRNEITYGFGLEISRRGGSIPSGSIAVPGLPTIRTNGVKIAPSEATFVSPRGSLGFTRHNIRGLAETASLSLLVARLDQKFVATYADPHFRGSVWNSLFSLSAERTTQNPLFAARLEDASFQLERPLKADKTVMGQVRYTFQKTDLNQLLVPALVLPQDRHIHLSTLSGTIIRDTRDKPLDAHRGMYQTADISITGSALGSSANFARFLGQSAYYKGVGHGIVWANSVRLGLEKAYGNSDIPTSERFFSGGGTTLRGFPINGAGPQRIVPFCGNPTNPSTCANITVPIGGPQLVVFNSEMRFPLPIVNNLGAVLFYDGGNVYRHVSFARFYQDYTNTVGVGLRYNTPVGPIRFDIGKNLNPVPGFRSIQFFVTLGQAF